MEYLQDFIFPVQRRRFVDVEKTGELTEQMVSISRVAKVVKGGRRFSFSALVVVGDSQGHVGYGLGKAPEVPDAIRKATDQAKRNIIFVPTVNGTITHELVGKFGATTIVMKPASQGTGVIAGGAVRAVLELAGVGDVLSKCLGSRSPLNVARGTIDGLKHLRTFEESARLRGVSIRQMLS